MEYRDFFLFYMNLQVVFWGVDLYSGSTYIRENTVVLVSKKISVFADDPLRTEIIFDRMVLSAF